MFPGRVQWPHLAEQAGRDREDQLQREGWGDQEALGRWLPRLQVLRQGRQDWEGQAQGGLHEGLNCIP